jgi:hypothetical protein
MRMAKLTGMPPTKVGKLAPVTLGLMWSQGFRDLLVYCNSDRCHHSIIINVGHLPDETPIKSPARRWLGMCEVRPSRCGRGAERRQRVPHLMAEVLLQFSGVLHFLSRAVASITLSSSWVATYSPL